MLLSRLQACLVSETVTVLENCCLLVAINLFSLPCLCIDMAASVLVVGPTREV